MKLKNRTKKFLIGYTITFILGLIWPISVILNIGEDGLRWVQNSPAKTVFYIVFFPLSVGTFFSLAKFNYYLKMNLFKKIFMGGILVFMWFIAIGILINDLTDLSRPCAPYKLRGQESKNALYLEKDLRGKALKDQNSGGKDDYVAAYMEKIKPFHSFKDFLKRGSFAAYWLFFLELISIMFFVAFLWLLFLVSLSKELPRTQEFNGFSVCFSFLLIWFPLMIYTEWYFNFYKLLLQGYSSVLMPVAIFSTVIFIFLLSIHKPYFAIVSLINIFITLFTGAVGIFKPNWALAVMWSIERMHPFSYFSCVAVLLITMIVFLNKIHKVF